jgi:hypothetical protein
MPAMSPSPDPVKAWLAALMRGAEPGPMPDEAMLLDTAGAEGVLALCHDRLRRSPAWEQYPATLRAALTRDAYQEVVVELVRVEELREVLEALARQGLSVLLLKGAALAYTLYPEPYLRSRSDTDLLLPSREDAERAWRVLQNSGYQRSYIELGDLIHYELGCYKISHGGLIHTLDLHWQLSNTALFTKRFTFTELAAAAIPIPTLGLHAYGLDPVHALLLACMHRITNMWLGTADRLIWIYDIHLLVQHLTNEQWQQIIMLAEERMLCGPCLNGFNSAQSLLATVLPDDIQRRLRTGATQEGFDPRQTDTWWRFEWLALCTLPSTIMRLRRLGQYLFPSVEHMRHRYGFHNLLWLPWFYSLRIVQRATKAISLGRNQSSAG